MDLRKIKMINLALPSFIFGLISLKWILCFALSPNGAMNKMSGLGQICSHVQLLHSNERLYNVKSNEWYIANLTVSTTILIFVRV